MSAREPGDDAIRKGEPLFTHAPTVAPRESPHSAIHEGEPPQGPALAASRAGASTDRGVQVRRAPSPRRAAAMIALAWLPALLLAAFLPRFVPVFDRWHWELPPLTHVLMAVGRLGV